MAAMQTWWCLDGKIQLPRLLTGVTLLRKMESLPTPIDTAITLTIQGTDLCANLMVFPPKNLGYF